MGVKENKALTHRLVEEALNEGNLDIADELFADDFVDHQGGLAATGGREDAKQFIRALRMSFPEVRFEIEHLAAEGDLVMLHLVARATHKGQFREIPATGRQVEWAGMGVLRIKDGKVAERWNVTDLESLVQQLTRPLLQT
jgi:steroid delta-isomerase-like uncharacterized protein